MVSIVSVYVFCIFITTLLKSVKNLLNSLKAFDAIIFSLIVVLLFPNCIINRKFQALLELSAKKHFSSSSTTKFLLLSKSPKRRRGNNALFRLASLAKQPNVVFALRNSNNIKESTTSARKFN